MASSTTKIDLTGAGAPIQTGSGTAYRNVTTASSPVVTKTPAIAVDSGVKTGSGTAYRNVTTASSPVVTKTPTIAVDSGVKTGSGVAYQNVTTASSPVVTKTPAIAVDTRKEPSAAEQKAEALIQELQNMYTGAENRYQAILAQQEAANRAAVQQATNTLNTQKKQTEQSYASLYRQLYIDRMNTQKSLNERLAAQGLSGGASESAMLGLAASYEDALRQGEESRISAINNLDTAIANAQLSGDIATAQSAADLVKDQINSYTGVLKSLITHYDTLAEQQAENQREAENTAWNRNYQLSRDAVTDARYQDERDYKLNRDALTDARYQDEWDYKVNRDAVADARYDDTQNWNRSYQLSRDAVNDLRYIDEQNWDRNYRLSRDAVNDARYGDETAYSRDQDALSYALRLAEIAAQYGDYSLLNNYGIRAIAPVSQSGGYGGGGSGGSSSEEEMDPELLELLQKYNESVAVYSEVMNSFPSGYVTMPPRAAMRQAFSQALETGQSPFLIF